MEIVCKNCHQGIVTGGFGCSRCRAVTPVSQVLEYERVNYFLQEMEKTGWRKAIAPTVREDLLRPYRVNQRTAALRLGIIGLDDTPQRRVWGYALTRLLTDLTMAAPTTLSQADKTRLREHLLNERDLLEADYAWANRAAPTRLDNLTLSQQKAGLEKSLEFIGLAQMDESSRASWSARYRCELELVAAQAVQMASEIQQKAQAVQVAQRAEIRRQLDQATRQVATPPVAAASPAPVRPRIEFRWENVWSALLSETTLRALFYLGALFVVVAAALYMTLNWNTFPALIQASTLLAADLAFFGGAFAIMRLMRLRRAGLTFLAIASALLPLAFYGYSRPGLIDLNNQGTWTLVACLSLPCYIGIAWLVRERLFSYLASLAALNALWAGLFQVGLPLEWLAAVSIPAAAGLVWLDGRLNRQASTREWASAPFWVGQVTVAVAALGLFSYFLNVVITGQPTESMRWGLGATWWLTTVFYAWCARQDERHRSLYMSGAALAGAVAAFLTMQKLPVPAEWQGVMLGGLGLAYLIGESLPGLARHLEADGNRRAWGLEEVLGFHRPFGSLGVTLLAGGLYLSSSSLTWAASCLLVAVALAWVTSVCNWPRLAWGATGALAMAGFQATGQLNLHSENWGWGLAGTSVAAFGVWTAVGSIGGRARAYRRPFEALAFLSALALLPASYVNHHYLYTTYSPSNLNWLMARDWLLLAVIMAGTSVLYRVRWGLDAALALVAASWLLLAWPSVSLGLIIAGIGMLLVGGLLLEYYHRPTYGLALEQWGYALATLGLIFSVQGGPNTETFIKVAGLYLLMAAITTWLVYHNRLTVWVKLEEKLGGNELSLAWLWITLGLLPAWVWYALPFTSAEKGLIIAALSAYYLALAIAFAPLRRREGKTGPGPYTVPALLGWLALGSWSLSLVQFEPVYRVEVTAGLALTSIAAAYWLKNWRYHWLTVALVVAALWRAFQLTELDYSLTSLIVAGLAVSFAAVGKQLGQIAGLPFRVGSHVMAFASFCVAFNSALFLSWYTQDRANLIPLSLLSGLVLVTLYLYHAITHNSRWYYVAGLLTTVTLMMITHWGYRSFEWQERGVFIGGLVGLASLAAAFYPVSLRWADTARAYEQSQKKGKTLAHSRHSLSYLSHIWAGIASGLVVFQQPGVQALTIAALTVLYIVRSWHEHRADRLILAALGGVWLILDITSLAGLEMAHVGLPLVGLGTFYLVLAWSLARFERAAYNFERASQIMFYGGVGLLSLGLLVTTNAPGGGESLLALVILTVVTAWLGWQDWAEWLYGSAVCGLATVILAWELTGGEWAYFGLALFGPAALLALVSFGLRRAGPEYRPVSQWIGLASIALTGTGLPFSWQRDPVMLLHTVILTGLTLVGLRLTRRVEWLYGAAATSCYAAALVISLLGVGWDDYGLALLPVSMVYLAATFYLARRASWLDDKSRLHAVIVLITLAQGVALAGLYFSWTTDRRLAISLAALTAFYLFDLAVTGWAVWLYAALAGAHLAALAGYSTLATGGTGLVPSQSALLLLVAGLLMTLLAVRLGRTSGYNLRSITSRLMYDPTGWANWLKIKSLPLYLAALLDLSISLGLSTGNSMVGLVVAGTLALLLLAVALVEQIEGLTWAGLTMGGVAALFYARLTIADASTGVWLLAGAALALTIAAYTLSTPILTRPFRWSAHLAALSAVILWLATANTATSVDNLSWLLTILGLTYLLVSLIEDRRRPTDQTWRYLGYGATLALAGAWLLRLGINSVTQLQFYVLPVGLACLGFAWVERSYLNRRTATLLEGLGLILVLGTSLLQAFGWQTVGLDRHWYGLLTLAEGLAAVGFGAANRLRYYFFGAIAALLLDLVALGSDSIHNSNLWITIGLTGLVLITVALFLERKREAVITVSKEWFSRLKEWQ